MYDSYYIFLLTNQKKKKIQKAGSLEKTHLLYPEIR